jgi:CRISPR/Cas system-associated exonuclease Cas4 (RecB family)
MAKNIYYKENKEPFRLSRAKIDLYFDCPRCFYLDMKFGVSRPLGFQYSLNQAVDTLLKKEFDLKRAKDEPYPLLKRYGLKLKPFKHQDMKDWRDNRRGIRYYHQPTNFEIYGAIDDVWVDENEVLYIVDFKSTSTTKTISLDEEWKDSYKRQMEIYQWLFRRNGFKVSNTGYFIYCNGKTDREAFDAKLEFDISVLAYDGDDKWVEKTLFDIKKLLESDEIPLPSSNCNYCNYYHLRKQKDSS